MPEALLLTGTDEFPAILLDAEKQQFEISGRSLPENVNTVYEPVLNWINSYLKNPNPKTEINIKLEYFNSASAKKLTEILLLFETASKKGIDVQIKWFYRNSDETMEAKGRFLKKAVQVPFEVIEF